MYYFTIYSIRLFLNFIEQGYHNFHIPNELINKCQNQTSTFPQSLGASLNVSRKGELRLNWFPQTSCLLSQKAVPLGGIEKLYLRRGRENRRPAYAVMSAKPTPVGVTHRVTRITS